MLDEKNINDTAETTGLDRNSMMLEKNEGRPEEINKCFISSFVFVIALGMFQFGKCFFIFWDCRPPVGE